MILAVKNPASPETPTESLSGLIERVTFFNEDTGFAVLKVKVRGHRDLVTVVGTLASVGAGEWVHGEGRWLQDREFGRQFRADSLTSTAPTTREGIEKYLGSGMVRALARCMPGNWWRGSGSMSSTSSSSFSARLEEVEGIGPERRRRIKEAWAEQKVVREIMVFLHSHGVSTSRAVRIYKTYGVQAIDRVRLDPYSLARDIPGIGFKTADEIARKLGVPHDSLARASAGLAHALLTAMNDGHCALPVELLKREAGKLLLVEAAVVEAALTRSLAQDELVQETVGDEDVDLPAPRCEHAEEADCDTIRSTSLRSRLDFQALTWTRLWRGARRRQARNWRQASALPCGWPGRVASW